MTTQDTAPQEAPRVFVTAKEAQGKPRTEQTDEDIRAWLEREIDADKKTLDLLATL